MQIARKVSENFLLNMVLGKKLIKDINSKNHFSCLFTWEWAK